MRASRSRRASPVPACLRRLQGVERNAGKRPVQRANRRGRWPPRNGEKSSNLKRTESGPCRTGNHRRQSARVGVSHRGGPDAQVDAVPTEHRSRSDDLCAKLRSLPTAGIACTHVAACVAPNTRRLTSLRAASSASDAVLAERVRAGLSPRWTRPQRHGGVRRRWCGRREKRRRGPSQESASSARPVPRWCAARSRVRTGQSIHLLCRRGRQTFSPRRQRARCVARPGRVA